MRIVLMHFPKAGGTTLHDLIAKSLFEEKIYPERFNNFAHRKRPDIRQTVKHQQPIWRDVPDEDQPPRTYRECIETAKKPA